MKVIDLLNKIANGEEVPKKIRFHCHNYEFNQDAYCIDILYYEIETGTEWLDYTDFDLNDEIEIIEEPKKIERLDEYINCDSLDYNICNFMFEIIVEKLNEIIDYINKGE